MMPRLNRFKVVVVTDRTDLQDQLGATAQLSGEAVRPTDEDLRSRESPTALTQRLLSERTPDIVMAMLQKYQPVGAKPDAKSLTVSRPTLVLCLNVRRTGACERERRGKTES